MKTVVSQKGQITIPKSIRDSLGLKQGSVLEVKEEKGKLVAVKKETGNRMDRVYGILKRKESSDQLIDFLRGTAEED